MFIDVHCHLNLLHDVADAIARAEANNVLCIVTQGVNTTSNRLALDYATEFVSVKAALGLYPEDLEKMTERAIEKEIDFIRKQKSKIVAIGEVGLDLKEAHDFKKQQWAFGELISLAIELDKPLIVHSRKAELQAVTQLERARAKKVLMHCFSGKLALAEAIVKNGWYLSIPTSVKNSEHFQSLIRQTPIEQLLCETDSPYLHPRKEFPNEPANVLASYEMIAKIKDLSLEDVEKQIEKNYIKLFGPIE
ncbi:MAG: TatD family hydrolase [Nanoarchaeota archaeon]